MWYNQKPTKKIIQEIADKYNLSFFEVKEIVESQYSLFKEILLEKRYETVRFPNFGKFTVKFVLLNRVYEKYKDLIDKEKKDKLMEGLIFKYDQYLKDKTIKRRYPEEKITKDLLEKYGKYN